MYSVLHISLQMAKLAFFKLLLTTVMMQGIFVITALPEENERSDGRNFNTELEIQIVVISRAMEV